MNKKIAPAGAIMIVLVIAMLVGIFVWNKCEEVSNLVESSIVAAKAKKATKADQNKNQIQTKVDLTDSETADRKVYKNDKYGLEFKYPTYFSDLENIFSPRDEVAVGTSGSDFSPNIVKSFNFYICSSGICDNADFIKQDCGDKNYSSSPIRIGDEEGTIFIYNNNQSCNSNNDKICYHVVAFFEKNNMIYEFNFWGSGNDNLDNVDDTVIGEIISTFKFTK
jgi:hypothetical protein